MDREPFKRLNDEPDLALKLITKRYGKQLMKRIKYLVADNDELVKDIVQETLVVLWTDREKVSKMKDPFVWMMVIAKNTALSKLRNEHQDLRVSIKDVENVASISRADTELNYKETLENIVLNASKLTPKEQEILIDSKLGGMENKELEEKYGLAPQRIKNLLSSGLKKIRQLLRD